MKLTRGLMAIIIDVIGIIATIYIWVNFFPRYGLLFYF